MIVDGEITASIVLLLTQGANIWYLLTRKRLYKMRNCPTEFVGTWFLQAMSLPGVDSLPPFLNQPYGVIVYAADGFMSTTVSSSVNADAADDCMAHENMMHYAGFWEVEGGEVIHTIAFSPKFAEVGMKRARRFRMDGDNIFLTDGSFESHYRRTDQRDVPTPIVVKAP